MIDEASRALFRDRDLISGGKGILLADENFKTDVVLGGTNITFITNRIDIAAELEAAGFNGEVNDFDLSNIPKDSLDFVLFRLSKMKLLTNHLLEAAVHCLKPGGHLILTGNNQEGIKSVIKNAAKIGEVVTMELLGKGLRYADIIKQEGAELNLKGEAYRQWIKIEEGDVTFVTKPGIYGYKKIDEGSRFLVESLKAQDLEGRILDLGCGYGYLTAMLGRGDLVRSLIATDNNVAAVEACEKNIAFLAERIPVEVTLDHCGSQIPDRTIDRIICNPPFHQGFSTSTDLTRTFVQATKRLLRRKGIAYFVLNRFIAIEKICEEESMKYQEIAVNNQFKLLTLERLR